MNENDIAQRIDMILKFCRRIEAVFSGFTSQGRMASLEEAKELDAVSQDLIDTLESLPPGPCAGIESFELRCRTEAVLGLAADILKTVVDVPDRLPAARAPRAAASRLVAYQF